jgi:transcription elongation regulator 1
VYFYNTFTEESSWEKPEGFAGDVASASALPRPVSSTAIKGTPWSEVVCDDGRKYFFNAETEVASGRALCAVGSS